jgi:acyl-CoA thioester hydrolase
VAVGSKVRDKADLMKMTPASGAKKRLVGPTELSPKLVLATKVRVIYGDTDQMGVVYHGNYARYFEQGRVDRMRDLGLHYREMEATGVGLPVLDLAVSYVSPARFDDIVSVYVGLSRVTMARVNFCYRLVVEPGDRYGLSEAVTICYGETRHGCLDMKTFGATRLPEHYYDALCAEWLANQGQTEAIE